MKLNPKLLTLATTTILLIGPVMPGMSSLPGFGNDALAQEANNDKATGSTDTGENGGVKNKNDGQDKSKKDIGKTKGSANHKKDSQGKSKKNTNGDDDDLIDRLDGET